MERRRFIGLSGRSALLVTATGGSLSLLLNSCSNGGNQPTATESPSAGNPRTPQTDASVVPSTFTTSFGFLLSFVESYVAKEEGFWEDEGLDITINGGQGAASALQTLIAGSSNFSRAGGISSIVAIARQGVPLVNVATVYQTSQFLLATPGSEPLNPSELAGKTVGIVSAGGTTENLLLVALAKAGIDPATVARPIVGVGAAALELAKRGEVDGWIALMDDVVVLRDQGEKIATINTNDIAFVPSDSYVVPIEFTEQKPDLVKRFLSGLLSAVEFALDEANVDKVIAAVQVYNPAIDPARARMVIPVLRGLWTAAGREAILEPLPADWEKGQNNVADAGLIDRTVPVERLIDPSFITAVKGG